MKTNYRKPFNNKEKDMPQEEFERRETKVKVLKTARKEKHATKNQRPHQLVRYFMADDEEEI